jgi:DNA polymerase-3 subunit gamma/tau
MLYRKYRPQTFSDVVGQEHVVQTLRGALATNRVGHAYLFSGPRGTGKTTVARVLAKALNCSKRGKTGDPCNTCDSCTAVNEGRSMDLIEIDGASNGRVDEIRDLKESASVAAPGGGYKVFLIDEVHMVTKEAFNALLKVLEEPPAHVMFILATTDPQKILATVLSRVQRFDFKKLTTKEIIEKLATIVDAEKVAIDPDALQAIAASSDGALRDAEVMLTKVIAAFPKGGKITDADVHEILGLIPLTLHPEFLGHLANGDKSAALACIQRIVESGASLEHFTKDFLDYTRKVLVTKVNPAVLASVGQDLVGEAGKALSSQATNIDGQKLIKILESFAAARNELKFSPIPQLPLELAVFDVIQ